MLKKNGKSFIAVVEQLAIAFFFATLFFTIVHFTVGKTIDTAVALTNLITIEKVEIPEIELQFDFVSRTLKKHPDYGKKWGTISLPSIGVNDIPIKQGDSLEIIRNAAGHNQGTYFPGEGGSIVICAHNSRQHFYNLPKTKKGDLITIQTKYGKFVYQVYATRIIKDTEHSKLPIQDKSEILMLYTCYPVGTIGHKDKRFVVYAKLVDLEYTGGA